MRKIAEENIVYSKAGDATAESVTEEVSLTENVPVLSSEPQPDAASLSASDVATQAFENLAPSAKQFATDIIQPIISPVETFENFKGLGSGIYQLFTPGVQPDEAKAKAVGKFFSDRYGGWENIKSTMAQDPVGFLADLSVIVSGGGMLAARAPATAGTVASVIQKAGKVIDPLQAPGQAISGVAKGMAAVPALEGAAKALRAGTVDLPLHILGLTSGAGGEALKIAAEAGRRGGEYSKTFLNHMKNKVPIGEIVDIARAAAKELRTQRQAQYLAKYQKLKKHEGIIDFGDIDKAMDALEGKGKFGDIAVRGEQPGKVLAEIKNLVDQFKRGAPDQYHTPVAIDALKQAIYDVGKDLPYGSTSRRVADEAYAAVRNEIVKQFDEYGTMMKDYENMSSLIDEVEKTMSIPAAKPGLQDTAIRKLTSAMRNNVSTAFGRRQEIVDVLSGTQAGRNLKPALAGRAVEPRMPSGIIRAGVLPAVAYAASHPGALLAAPALSPRFVGRAAHTMGKRRGQLGRALHQTGRTSRATEPQVNTQGLAQALRRPVR